MCEGKIVTLDDLPPTISQSSQEDVIQVPVGITMEEAEKIIILQNLAVNKGNKTKTADILGIGRKTLHRKLDEWNEGGETPSE